MYRKSLGELHGIADTDGGWDAPPVARNLSQSILAMQPPDIHCCKILWETPAELLSLITYGIWFCGGNFRQCSLCEMNFVQDMLSILLLFLEWVRLTAVWSGLQLLSWNKSISIFLHPLGAGTLSGQSLQESNLPFPTPPPQASIRPICHTLQLCLLPIARKNSSYHYPAQIGRRSKVVKKHSRWCD